MTNPTVLDQIDPDVAERIGSRRDALRGFGAACAVASFPIAFAASAKAAFAQDGGALPEEVVDVLNFALTLEYLENSFYEKGLATDGLIPDTNNNRQIFETIQNHEAEHVEFLESTLGDKAVEKPTFDFTAGGKFDTFQTYKTFLLLSQAFEDTGVRAYRGQAGALAGSPKILTAALTIHSVEARHAANVRLLRDLTGWIPQSEPGAPAAVEPVYAGMDETTKYKVDVPDVSGVEPANVTEAFDEPLSKKAVLAIAGQFIKS
ncbi:MAG TPA: ferritin-like domain-containing protein [Solirubrobacteraceae bacterium]|nr:ferritin-like domain-containing protein [Solirubrobacteraceae bacterium]